MSEQDEKLQRIVDARLKLRERFKEKEAQTPGMSDDRPMGEGAANRHGMPKLPPDQYQTQKWPVLDLGIKPSVGPEKWQLRIDGAVEEPATLSWADFQALPQDDDESDFHCVTKWALMD